MSKSSTPSGLKSVPDTGENESIMANCLICGREIHEHEDVLPLICVEQGQPVGFMTVVCEQCVQTFDDRVVGFIPTAATVVAGTQDGGMVM